VDWDWLLEAATAHGVVPLVHRALARICPPSFRTAAEQIARHNLRLTAELLAILDALDVAGIRAVSFKGPTLAASVYGDVALRTFRDLDLLVPGSALAHARAALGARGYAGPAPTRHMWQHRLTHADGFMVELHNRLSPPEFPFPPDAADVWRHPASVRLGSRMVATLGPDQLLLFLCGHGAKHGWERLAWIVDVAELMRRDVSLDWRVIGARARAQASERMLLLGVQLAADLLGAPAPASLAERARADRHVGALASIVCGRLFTNPRAAGDTWNVRTFHWHVRERWRDRAKYILKLIATPGPADFAAVPLPRWLHWLYYGFRPLRLAVKYGPRALAKWTPQPR